MNYNSRYTMLFTTYKTCILFLGVRTIPAHKCKINLAKSIIWAQTCQWRTLATLQRDAAWRLVRFTHTHTHTGLVQCPLQRWSGFTECKLSRPFTCAPSVWKSSALSATRVILHTYSTRQLNIKSVIMYICYWWWICLFLCLDSCKKEFQHVLLQNFLQ